MMLSTSSSKFVQIRQLSFASSHLYTLHYESNANRMTAAFEWIVCFANGLIIQPYVGY